jgi:hypothetical protein
MKRLHRHKWVLVRHVPVGKRGMKGLYRCSVCGKTKEVSGGRS